MKTKTVRALALLLVCRHLGWRTPRGHCTYISSLFFFISSIFTLLTIYLICLFLSYKWHQGGQCRTLVAYWDAGIQIFFICFFFFRNFFFELVEQERFIVLSVRFRSRFEAIGAALPSLHAVIRARAYPHRNWAYNKSGVVFSQSSKAGDRNSSAVPYLSFMLGLSVIDTYICAPA